MMPQPEAEDPMSPVFIRDCLIVHPNTAQTIRHHIRQAFLNNNRKYGDHGPLLVPILVSNAKHPHEAFNITEVQLPFQVVVHLLYRCLSHARCDDQSISSVGLHKGHQVANLRICLVHRERYLPTPSRSPMFTPELVWIIFWKRCRPEAMHG